MDANEAKTEKTPLTEQIATEQGRLVKRVTDYLNSRNPLAIEDLRMKFTHVDLGIFRMRIQCPTDPSQLPALLLTSFSASLQIELGKINDVSNTPTNDLGLRIDTGEHGKIEGLDAVASIEAILDRVFPSGTDPYTAGSSGLVN
jgi:hypothetical protein